MFSCEFCEISKKHLSRRTSSDILTFLQEKLEFDKERLRQEQKQRERERERERDRQDNVLHQQQMLDRQM